MRKKFLLERLNIWTILKNNLNRNFVEPFFSKRVSFSHENEVRLVFVNPTYDVCNENVLGKKYKDEFNRFN